MSADAHPIVQVVMNTLTPEGPEAVNFVPERGEQIIAALGQAAEQGGLKEALSELETLLEFLATAQESPQCAAGIGGLLQKAANELGGGAPKPAAKGKKPPKKIDPKKAKQLRMALEKQDLFKEGDKFSRFQDKGDDKTAPKFGEKPPEEAIKLGLLTGRIRS